MCVCVFVSIHGVSCVYVCVVDVDASVYVNMRSLFTGVKASGGVRTLAEATAVIQAGADRIGMIVCADV